MRRALALLLVTAGGAAGCNKTPDAAAGTAPGGTAPGGPAPIPVDSSLVDLLADLALADARAETAPAPRRAAARDSLRAVALALHDVSPDEARARQSQLAEDPAIARATYDAVERALMSEPR